MNITKPQLLKNCLLSSIAHAIMTNIYPEFSYEQSWDANNFSFQNLSGIRGTFTFINQFCIGAIRDEYSEIIYGEENIKKVMTTFPAELIDIAYAETLQYLLVEYDNKAVPAITNVFWCDDKEFKSIDSSRKNIYEIFPFFYESENAVVKACQEYYDMDFDSLKLLNELAKQKNGELSKKMIPGDYINEECEVSLNELNIYI